LVDALRSEDRKKRRLELTRGNEDEIDRGEAAGVANPKLAGVVF
jgi:hypothetical protein